MVHFHSVIALLPEYLATFSFALTPIQNPSSSQMVSFDSSSHSVLSPLSLTAASFSILHFMPAYTHSTIINAEYEYGPYEGIRSDTTKFYTLHS
ncbi:hypothetical protein C8R45DRAFT_9740 [Mycena sanguinolenta]|nr:hypothetical protein C8R45DRAFT_9740 [Mycena sanguinolenta]